MLLVEIALTSLQVKAICISGGQSWTPSTTQLQPKTHQRVNTGHLVKSRPEKNYRRTNKDRREVNKGMVKSHTSRAHKEPMKGAGSTTPALLPFLLLGSVIKKI